MHLDTISRIRHLSEIATARHLASRDLGDRLRSVRDERRRLADRREHVLAVGQYAPTGTDEEVKRIDARLADLDDTIADLFHREQDAGAAFQAAKTLEVNCREFAAENNLPTPETVIGDRDSYDGARQPHGLGMVPNVQNRGGA